MEADNDSQEETSKKRPSEHVSEDEPSKPKKPRLYSVKQFRKQLHTNEKLQALTEFTNILSSSSKHDYVLDYLKDGGNCLELLQTLEQDSAVSPAVVFDLITHVLLGITSKHGQYQNSAYEACRYLINNFLPVVHKMLGLSSTKEERKVCLKLLTAMAAFSSNLARDLLLNVKFHSANIELLTKHTGEKNSVRDYFVRFLTAFLVDSEWHTLSVLLDKSGLLTSIISGLQYDNADTVCIVVTAMKNYILENPSVTKTLKMYVFNTAVVKDIVNLYNWKGLEGLKALDKNNKNVALEVDKVAKSKVSECVHDFLIVLCTSNKFGLVFRDHSVGLGKKNSNGLIYTVLDSLDRPWEHSYASDLVIKICKSCPDLTKNMWLILKPYLEPRLTEKWLNAMDFAGKLVEAMEPECIEFCAKELSAQQLSQIIEILVSPLPILKTLQDYKPEDKDKVAYHIIKLLCFMLKQVNKFLDKIQTWINSDICLKTTHILANFIYKHYPKPDVLLEEWNKLEPSDQKQTHLEVILDVLSLYKKTAPQLLASLSFDFNTFLFQLSDFENVETIQIKLVEIFVDVDQAAFLPKTKVFAFIVPILLKKLHETKDGNIQNILRKLLKNSGIFDNNPEEIDIWLSGIFNLNTLKVEFLNAFVDIFKDVTSNLWELQKELSELSSDMNCSVTSSDLIEQLLSLSENLDDSVRKPKRTVLSPTVIGLLKCCKESTVIYKSTKKYSEFVLLNLVHEFPDFDWGFQALFNGKFSEVVPSNVSLYVNQWIQGEPTNLPKIKGCLGVFRDISEQFLSSSCVIEQDRVYPYFWVDVLRMCVHNFSKLLSLNLAKDNHHKNFISLIHHLTKSNQEIFTQACLEHIFDNSTFVKLFSLTSKKARNALATQAVFEVVKELEGQKIPLESYKSQYSHQILGDVKKFLKNTQKHPLLEDFKNFIEAFPFNYWQCTQALSLIADCAVAKEDQTLLQLLISSFQRLVQLHRNQLTLNPLDRELLHSLSGFMVQSNSSLIGDLAQVLRQYLVLFPHTASQIDPNLFPSLLTAPEYNKDSVDLVVFLLKSDISLVKHIEDNVVTISEKKGLVLPLVDFLLEKQPVNESLLKNIYDNLESAIIKAIQKPQKVGQHFQKDYNVAELITKFMPLEKCASFLDKTQKFEVSEVFHAKLLTACYSKVLLQSVTNKQLGNIVTTFIHLLLGVLKKSTLDSDKVKALAEVFTKLLDKFNPDNLPLEIVNDSFKTFCKLSLKYGLSGSYDLLIILRKLLKVAKLNEEDARGLMDMLLSHSEFLNVVLGEDSDTKLAVLRLFLQLCQNWNNLMDRSHMAVLLASYKGMVTRCDRTILLLLKLYESKPEQTRFYDFKPFLCGRAAAIHYSVRNQTASSLHRQPKVSDVLGVLKEDIVNLTITNYPLKDSLNCGSVEETTDLNCYDLKFFLPLFSHILAPEQQVKTWVFIKSGALSLTVLGLACQDQELRQAACHVLARLHFHLEARQTGKDNLLWIRYVEGLCKGVALLPNFKLNTFSAVFFARTASILTNPKHVMFSPLSLYLTSKPDLDLSTIPELYTLLFSPDVNYKEHRNFILEVLRDGMRTEKDFLDFLRSMAYKLFSELFSSCLADAECRWLILEVVAAICNIPLGVKMLVQNHSLIPQWEFVVENLQGDDRKVGGKVREILDLVSAVGVES